MIKNKRQAFSNLWNSGGKSVRTYEILKLDLFPGGLTWLTLSELKIKYV